MKKSNFQKSFNWKNLSKKQCPKCKGKLVLKDFNRTYYCVNYMKVKKGYGRKCTFKIREERLENVINNQPPCVNNADMIGYK